MAQTVRRASGGQLRQCERELCTRVPEVKRREGGRYLPQMGPTLPLVARPPGGTRHVPAPECLILYRWLRPETGPILLHPRFNNPPLRQSLLGLSRNPAARSSSSSSFFHDRPEQDL